MGDFPMTMFAAFTAALVLTTVMAAPQHDVHEIVPETEYERASGPPVAARKEMTKTELLKTPDLTSPNSVIEWQRMWGKGADVTPEAKNEKSCKRRCLFKFERIGPHALKECEAGCSFYGEKRVIPAGQRCISGTPRCNGFLQAAANTCKSTCARRLQHEAWTIVAPLSASKAADAKVVKKMMKGKKGKKAKKGAKKAAKKKKAKKGAKKKSKTAKLKKAAMDAAKELDSNVDVAKFALHFCSQGCELAAANICFQGSGACLNTPDFTTKWPRVGSCSSKSNKCQANGTPTCFAQKCIKTKEQCHAACHTWHGQKSICLGECNPSNAMRSGKMEKKVIKKMMKGKGPKRRRRRKSSSNSAGSE